MLLADCSLNGVFHLFQAVMATAGVEGSKTVTNHVHEIEKCLGIEAARCGDSAARGSGAPAATVMQDCTALRAPRSGALPFLSYMRLPVWLMTRLSISCQAQPYPGLNFKTLES